MQSIRPLRPLTSTKSLFTLPPSLRLTLLRSSLHHRTITTSRTTSQAFTSSSAEPLIPPPHESSGPLLERLPNRDLPSISTTRFTWLRTLPIFLLLVALSSLGIFNYQKSSSSAVASILYSLRTSPSARELLGDEIYFASKVPWISGELNQLHGVIDVSFWVAGTKGKGKVKFVSVRKKRDGYFETLEWSLRMEDGREEQLLDKGKGDPMGQKKVEG